MNLIVSADKHWSIGKNGRPLVNIPAERQLLLKETAGKVVVMGRKALETLPGGQPLGGRTNVVLSAICPLRPEVLWSAAVWKRPLHT